jgi:hypothetical protein
MKFTERFFWANTVGYGLGDIFTAHSFIEDVVHGLQNPNQATTLKMTSDGANMTVTAFLTGITAVIGTEVFNGINRRISNQDKETASHEAQSGIIPFGARSRYGQRPIILPNGRLF